MAQCRCPYHVCANESMSSFVKRYVIERLQNMGLSYEHPIVKEAIRIGICIECIPEYIERTMKN